jgi:hypothetical protein
METTTATLTPFAQLKAKLKAEIIENVGRKGMDTDTSVNSNSYGWSQERHQALVSLEREGIEGVIISRSVKFEVTDWLFVAK